VKVPEAVAGQCVEVSIIRASLFAKTTREDEYSELWKIREWARPSTT